MLAIRKSEEKDVSFHVSRLVEAIWIHHNGSAEAVLEGMLTAGKKTKAFDSFEILIPKKVVEVRDVTESFLDEELFENKARNSYRLINKASNRVELSGILCEVVHPLGIVLLHNEEYCEIRIIFPKPVQPGEVRPFRIIFKMPKFARKTRSYYHGIMTYEFTVALYDILGIEHSDQLRKQMEAHKERLVKCERVYLWVVSPPNVEIIRAVPPPNQIVPHNRLAPLRKDLSETRKAISWELKALRAFPWSKMRLSGTFRRQAILSVTTIIALAGLLLSLVSLAITVIFLR